MPWTPKQMKVIRAKAHGWSPGGDAPFANVSKDKAKEMETEGLRPPVKGKSKKKPSAHAQATALRG